MTAKIKKGLLYAILIFLAVICLMPFLLMMVNATRTGSEIVKSFTLVPGHALSVNWAIVSSYFNLFKGMANSLLVALPATLFTSYFSAMAISFQTRFYSLIAPASPVPSPAEHPAAFFAAEAALPGTGFFSSSASSRMEYR